MQVPEWEHIPHLVHGFFGRRGGRSSGEPGALNLSFDVGDAPSCVRANWQCVAEGVACGLRFRTMRQCHGAEVARVDEATAEAPEVDGLLTCSRGLALCVLTADCVPVLLLAPGQGVIAAVHTGWRGTVSGVVGHALDVLGRDFDVPPAGIKAALGPAIGACCYEVEARIADQVEQRWGTMPEAVMRYGDRSRLDLRRINAGLLAASGVPPDQITTVGPCTRCANQDYFSYRAAPQGRTGRQLSFIAWSAPGNV